jgi:Zn-dependent membrane protease YugP
MPLIILGVLALLALTVLPQLWVRSVLLRHSSPRPAFPGTGGEFARHLLDGMKLGHVKVEETEQGDHYHPIAKAVRLKAEHFHGKSLTAIVIAAHEVGHAMQDATDYTPLKTRTRLAPFVDYVQTAGSVVLVAMSVLGAVLRHPAIAVLGIAVLVLMNLSIVIFHAITLPVEFDASFKRALPLLRQGRYLEDKDLASAQHILSAAAYTYVAAALMSLLNIARWLRR